jgi:hypothetical protein
MPTNTDHPVNIGAMLSAYIECAFWSSVDNNGRQMEGSESRLTRAARRQMETDCRHFIEWCTERGIDLSVCTDAQHGHDFWLTRNRHGAGYWDRGLGATGTLLTDAAHVFGSSDLYVGRGGWVHVS